LIQDALTEKENANEVDEEAVKGQDISKRSNTLNSPKNTENAPSVEALEEAREALQNSANLLIHHIQKALLALKVSSDIISADTITLTQQISQSASSLANVGAVYASLNVLLSFVAMLTPFSNSVQLLLVNPPSPLVSMTSPRQQRNF
jgi:hypothetical protein